MTDPFTAPGTDEAFESAPDVSAYPKPNDLRGHLLLIRPTKFEGDLLSQFSKPGKPQYQDRITADVIVLDGPLENFEETEFFDMYFSQVRLVSQLKPFVKRQGLCLARLDTFRPGQKAEQGNPWGLVTEFTDEDAQLAREHLKKTS